MMRLHAGPAPVALALLVLLTVACVTTAPAPEPIPPADSDAAASSDAAEEAQVAEPVGEPETGPAPETATAPAPPDEADTDPSTCYYGPTRQILADGSERPGADLLLRHTYEPEGSRIVEQTVRFEPEQRMPPRLYTAVYDIEGDTFTLAESNGEYSGGGTLEGEAWNWTGWSSDYTLQSGIRVQAEYTFTTGEDGRPLLEVHRTAYGPDGSQALVLIEELARIGAVECAERMEEAVGGEAG